MLSNFKTLEWSDELVWISQIVEVFAATTPILVEAASDHSCRKGELGHLEGDPRLAGKEDGKDSGL